MATNLSSPAEPTPAPRSEIAPLLSSPSANTPVDSVPALILIGTPPTADATVRPRRVPVYSRGERPSEPLLDTESIGSEPLKSEAAHLVEMGLLFFRKNMEYEAISMYQQALDQEPDSAMGHYLLGVALQALKQGVEARSEWKAAVASDESGTEAEWARERAALLLQRTM